MDPETQEKFYFEKSYPEPSEEEFLATQRELARKNPVFQPAVSTQVPVSLNEIPKEEVSFFPLSFCLFILTCFFLQEKFDLKKEKKVWKWVQPQLFIEGGEEPAQKKRKQE